MQKLPSDAIIRPTSRPVRRLLFACTATALLIFLSACGGGGGEEKASPAASPKPLEGPEETVELYRNTCISCHGAELEGKMGDQSNLQTIGATMTKEQIRAQIENGGELMPAFKTRLKPEQIDALADWLSGLK